MFCDQCQETLANEGCTRKGVCGKTDDVADLQDLMIHCLRGLSYFQVLKREKGKPDREANRQMLEVLFATITNANFDRTRMIFFINRTIEIRDRLRKELEDEGTKFTDLPDHASWSYRNEQQALEKAKEVGVLSMENVDIRSLSTLLLYGMKGMAAYADHALTLDHEDEKIFSFMNRGLLAYRDPDASIDTLLPLVMECGEIGVVTMSLLDEANTSRYGVPTPHKVKLGVRKNPGILISGHELKDLEELLEQTKGSGIDVYTHGEMLPANYYPFFERYDNLVGNYGGSWWHQTKDFETFNGPVLLTTNCLVPPLPLYKGRVYTTATVGFEGVPHIQDRKPGEMKDFSGIIEHAKRCAPPTEIESGEIVGGFNHRTLWDLKDKVMEAVGSGKIKKFIVMAGCDGRHRSREYYSDFASALPKDTVILTAGCAKYRYNKIIKDDIDGIPRVIDAGQCNDSFSLVAFALKLADHLGVGVNDLPIGYNIAWYEQKAVLVLLALLYLGVKNIHLGPTLPAFVSPNVLNILIDKFGIGGTASVEEDVAEMMA
ncbi:MAG: hydroxylamine reductase [Candidatus Thermoplasmatota archaeon]|nr:hydroxylamine reductase [Candidatus Thermoplasmatota archaeon]